MVEIIRPIKSGQTQPYQCRLEDDQIYAVKGRGALPEGLLSEVCAASLGQAMGLPIPDFVIAEIPAVLIETATDPEVSRYLGIGTGFASHWRNACEPLTPTIRDRQSPEFLATLYAFDHWIANGDRSLGDEDGNPNLLYDLTDKKLVAFDHNLAFSTTYNAAELAVHAGRRSWQAIGRSSGFIPRLLQKMQIARLAFNALVNELPHEWVEDRPGFTLAAAAMLDRCDTPEFWAELG
ncbi:HipA family kinase [Sphingomonas sp. CJ20]